MRFVYATPDHARASAKELCKVLSHYDVEAPLGVCQGALSKALGYDSWAELKLASGSPERTPSPFDADASADVVKARFSSLCSRLEKTFGLEAPVAMIVANAVAPTSGGQSHTIPYDMRFGGGEKEFSETINYEIRTIGNLRQVGMHVHGMKDDRVYTPIYMDGNDEAWSPNGHFDNRYLDALGILEGYKIHFLRDAKANELAGCGNADPARMGQHYLARLSLLQRTVLPKLAWSTEHGLMRPVSPHHRIVQQGDHFCVEAVIDIPTPTDLHSCFARSDEAKDALVMIGHARHRDDSRIVVRNRIEGADDILRQTTADDIVRGAIEAYAVEAEFVSAHARREIEMCLGDLRSRSDHGWETLVRMAGFEKSLKRIDPGFVPATADGKPLGESLNLRGLLMERIEVMAKPAGPTM